MNEINWISQEAHRIHDYFQGVFYLLVTVFLLLGVLIEYFKLPMGAMPSFGPLVGRILVAAILLHSYPEITNTVAGFSDALSTKLGNLTQFKLALEEMGKKVDQLTWSWTSVKESVIVTLCYLCFFLLYFSVHVAQALYLYTVVMLYIFSPVLIALFVLPQTAGATSGLFRSLFEVSIWKPVWCVIATLVWSTGISEIQKSGSSVSFLSAVCFCIIAAGSLILTPVVVHALASGGLHALASNLASVGIPGIASLTPIKTMSSAGNIGRRAANTGLSVMEISTQRYFPKINQAVASIPRFRVPPRPTLFEKPKNETDSRTKNKF